MTEKNNIYTGVSYYPKSDVHAKEDITFTTTAHQIARHLNSLNITLQKLDQDLVQYRISVKSEIKRNNLEEHLEERVELIKKIQAELKIYHFYKQFTLQVACQNFCYDDEHNQQPPNNF